MPPTPLVSCTHCHREWYSETMLEGLARLGACPRCGGELRFERVPRSRPAEHERFLRREPHLVLGRPRGRARE